TGTGTPRPAPPAGRGPTEVRSWLRPPPAGRPGQHLADAVQSAATDSGIAERPSIGELSPRSIPRVSLAGPPRYPAIRPIPSARRRRGPGVRRRPVAARARAAVLSRGMADVRRTVQRPARPGGTPGRGVRGPAPPRGTPLPCRVRGAAPALGRADPRAVPGAAADGAPQARGERSQ